MNVKRQEILDSAYKALKLNKFNGTVLLPTGTGKSSILVKALLEIKPKTCWYLCDSVLNRDETFKNEMIKWGAEHMIDNVKFMCYQTACKLEGEKVDLVLGDEVDMSLTPVYSKALTKNIFKKKVLVSATLTEDKRKLMEKIAPIVFETNLKELEGEGIINDSKYFVVNYMLNNAENVRYLKFNATFSALLAAKKPNTFMVQNTQIMRRLFLSTLETSRNTCKKLLKKLYPDEKRKILIFCGTAEQADAITKYTYHSKNNAVDVFKDFDEGRIRLMAVVDKVNRGVNINGVNTVIFEAPVKSNTKFQQKQGRAKRLSIGDYSDVFFLIPHFKDRYGNIKPTVIEKYVYDNIGKMKIKPKIYDLI